MTAQAKGGTQVASKCEYLDEFVSHAKKSIREKLKDKFTQMSLDRGQFIFFEGDDAAALYLVQEKQRIALAHGHTTVTLLDARTQRLVKEWPQEIWRRYQALQ